VPTVDFMRQPQSIRVHLAAVFLLFFVLVVVLGSFSIWRLSNFDVLSADVAEVWLPTTRALGDLNNYTSDFRAFEGSELLSSDTSEAAATESQMEELDRTIADSEREFEHIRHDAAENELYDQFKTHWTKYRGIVNQMLLMWRNGHKDDALQIYGSSSRMAYNAASDTLGQLTDQAVASAQIASDRLAVAYRQAFWLILLAIIIAGVLVVAALVHISRYLSAPLLDLAESMRRLAGNQTDTDIPGTKRRDEIGEMAHATIVFRNNAIELMHSQRMLARQAALLEEQLAHEQRLALQQRNFVSMASHEFRTPLTVIDGHARRLDKFRETMQSGEISERAGKIRSAVLRMTHLIDNLLGSSRLMDGSGSLYFQPADMDMTALLQEVCQLHRDMVPASQIAERFDTVPLPMTGDAKLLFQAVSNLLANAIKYSPGGGAIEVQAESTPDEVIVAVSDRGIGIPKDDFAHLFERYHRGSNVSGIVGTGVGLYLVKMAIDLHRGSIDVQSNEGEGSCFTIRLPRMTAAVPADRMPAAVAASTEAL
jgi:two-component system, OmpR family, sensor kinase